jgi:hypothetical protein
MLPHDVTTAVQPGRPITSDAEIEHCVILSESRAGGGAGSRRGARVYTRRVDGGEGEAVVGRITAGIVRERDVRLFGPHGLLVEAEESVKDLGAWFLFTRMEGRNPASGGGAAWVANGNRGPESRRAR